MANWVRFKNLFALHKLHGHLVEEEGCRIGRESTGHGWAKALEPDLPVATTSFHLQGSETLQTVPVAQVALHPGLDDILRITRHPCTKTSNTSRQQQLGGSQVSHLAAVVEVSQYPLSTLICHCEYFQ